MRETREVPESAGNGPRPERWDLSHAGSSVVRRGSKRSQRHVSETPVQLRGAIVLAIVVRMMRASFPLDPTSAFRQSMPERYRSAFDDAAVGEHAAIVGR